MKTTGDEYFDSDEFHDLLAEYEQALSTGQPVFMDADELAEIADYYQMTGQADQADKAINLALNLSPGAIAPLVYKVHEAIWNGDVALAKTYLSQVIEKDDPDYVYTTGEVMLAEQLPDEADRYFSEQLRTVPPDEQQDYVIDVAGIFTDYGYGEHAMAWMARAKQEDTPDFKELMARTLFGLGKYKDSERLFNELIDTDPFSKRYWNALASAQFMSEKYADAVQSSEFAIAIDPDDAEGIISKANGLYRLGNYEEAQQYYARYLSLEPDDDLALLHRGVCLINLERTEEALDVLRQALDKALAAEEETGQPSDTLVDIYQELAFALSEEGHTDEALAFLDKTDPLDCDHVQMEIVKGHVLLADERHEEAQQHFSKALDETDNPRQTLLRIIVSLYDNKYLEAAYSMFKRYFRLIGDDYDEGYAYMALCCYDMKRYDKFLDYLKEACRRNPEECRIVLRHLFPDNIEPENYYQYIKDKLQ